ncbi:phosphoribosylaminoimidazolesuccinocarboxamide synthase [bacterium]|nr:phosphoribosylaminoimidazolesuccinocarboxamide synthase [bacterium]
MDTKVIDKTRIDAVPLFRRGKVRDVYDLGDRLLIVATDRISAFDCVLPNPIPDKGKILTQLSLFWFDLLADLVENHLITADVSQYPQILAPYRDQLVGRSMLVRKAKVVPIECVVRGYLSGSGWADYSRGADVGGVRLPDGLEESERIPAPYYPLFSPATKEEEGHDQNIGYQDVVERLGEPLARRLRDTAVAIYRKAADYAESRGVILADTKFEFGLVDDRLILVDEILTPDSSRFWQKSLYIPGQVQKSYDKQYVRDYLLGIDWDRNPPAPRLPTEVIEKTRQRYVEAFQMLTGRPFLP